MSNLTLNNTMLTRMIQNVEDDSSRLSVFLKFLETCSDIEAFEALINSLDDETVSFVLPLLKQCGWRSKRFPKSTSMADLLSSFTAATDENTKLRAWHDTNLLIQSYSPATLMKDALKDPEPMAQCKLFTGACFIVDISGFTKMSSSFCLKGSKGLDDLHRVTNGYLGFVSSQIYKYGGDVIAFAGDAVLCIFPESKDTDEPQFNYCMRALLCAFTLRDQRIQDLSSHIGISCGELSLSTLGGYDGKWVYLLNGPPLCELSGCLDDAKACECVVTQQFFDHILEYVANMESTMKVNFKHMPSDNYKILSLGEGVTEVDLTVTWREYQDSDEFSSFRSQPSCHRFSDFFKESTGSLRNGCTSLLQSDTTKQQTSYAEHFVPKQVQDALELGTFDSMSELLEVTTMFLKVDSFSFVRHQNSISLQLLFFTAQEILYKTGGFLRQFLIDDKGCVIIAMWGVSGFSYPDNDQRAVTCAVQISQAVEALGHSCSIGISGGVVFCGNVGCMERRDYVAIGHNVNMAARLMSKAKGRILIDDSTREILPVSMKSLIIMREELQLKGVSDLMTVYVCDERELESCIKRLSEIPQHDPAIHLYVGDAIIERLQFVLQNFDDLDRFNLLTKSFFKIKRNNSRSIDFSNVATYANYAISSKSPSAKVISIFEGKNFVKNDSTHWHALETKFGIPMSAVSCTVIESSVGVGKSMVCNYLDSIAELNSGTRFVNIVAYRNETPFSVMRKLFFALFVAPDDLNFHSALKNVIQSVFLLKGDDKGAQERKLYCSLCNILGVSSECPSERSASRNASINVQQPLMHTLFHTGLSDERLFNATCGFLLLKRRTVVVIEQCQFCDERSWKQLRLFMHLPIALAMVLVVVTDDAEDSTSRESYSYSRSRTRRIKKKISPSFSGDSVLDQDAVFVDRTKSSSTVRNSTYRSTGSTSSMSAGGTMNGYFQKSASTYAKSTDEMSSTFMHIKKNVLTQSYRMPTVNRAMIRNVLLYYWNAREIPDRLVHMVHMACQDDPNLCKSIVQYINKYGIAKFSKTAGSCASVYMLAASGFDTLKPNEKAFVKFACVVGTEFSLSLVSCLVPKLMLPTVPCIIERLCALGIIKYTDEDIYAFQMPEIALAYYQLIPKSEAILLHAKIADYIEWTYVDCLPMYYRCLSFHNSKSPDRRESTVRFHILCADQSLSHSCYEEALSYLLKAVQIVLLASERKAISLLIHCGLDEMSHPHSGITNENGLDRGMSGSWCVPLLCRGSGVVNTLDSVYEASFGDTAALMDLYKLLDARLQQCCSLEENPDDSQSCQGVITCPYASLRMCNH